MRHLIITSLAMVIAFTSFSQTDATENVRIAQENYNEIIQALEQNRAARVQLQNQLEQNRRALRDAKRNLRAERNALSPAVVEDYTVLQNTLYEKMSQGLQSGFSVYIPSGTTNGLGNLFSKNVDSDFKAYMRNYSIGKIKKKKGELFFDNIVIPEVNEMPLDVYVDIVKESEGVTLKSFFYDGTKFIDFSQENNRTANAKNILVHFAKAIHKQNLEAQLEEKVKELEKAHKDLEEVHKSIAKLREEIGEQEIEISSSQNDIIEVEAKIDMLTNQIEESREQINRIVLN